MVESSVSAAN